MTVSEFINKVGFKVKQDDVKKVNSTISDIKSTATKLLGALGVGFSLKAINGLIEEFGAVNNSIRNSIDDLGEMDEVQNLILKKANEARTTYSDMASTVSNLVKSSSDLFPVEDAVNFSSNITKLLKSAGRTDAVISSVMEGFNKSFQKGIVDTETLNKLLEQAPEAANILAKSLGVTKSELLDMASNGRMSVTDLKDAFINASGEIDAAFANTDMTISDALKNIRNQWGLWLAQMDKTLGVTKTIAKAMVSGFNSVIAVLNKVRTAVVWLSEKLGGTENMLKLVAIAAGAIFIALKGEKILNFLKTAKTLISGISLKVLAIIAVIIVLALIVEDFINFMLGNKSVLGEVFDKLGIDAEKVRDTIKQAFTKVKEFLLQVWEEIKVILSAAWDVIKKVALFVFNFLADYWKKNGEKIKENFKRTWNLISSTLKGLWNGIKKVAEFVFGALKDFWDKNGESIKETFTFVWGAIFDTLNSIWTIILDIGEAIFGRLKDYFEENGDSIKENFGQIWDSISATLTTVWNVISQIAHVLFGGISDFFKENGGLIKDTFMAVWDAIMVFLEPLWNALVALAKNVFGKLKEWWDRWGGTIVQLFKSVWSIVSSVFKVILNAIKATFNVFAALFTGDWEKAWNSIKDYFKSVWDAIKNIFKAVWDFLKSFVVSAISQIKADIQGTFEAISTIFSTVWNAIKTVFTNIWSGIKYAATTAVNAIANVVSSVFNGIKNTVSNIWNGIKNTVSSVVNTMSSTISNVFNGIKNTATTVWNAIKNAIMTPINSAWNTVSGVISKIKNAFNFSWSLPSLKLPHISVTGGTAPFGIGGKGSLPKFSIQWYKDGGILSGAQIFGALGNQLLGGGEAGQEAVLPLNKLWSEMKTIVGSVVSSVVDDSGDKETGKGLSGIANSIRNVISGAKALASSGKVQPSTATTMNNSNVSNRNVTQNVNINNTFNGDRAIQQKASTAVKDSAKDATSELARGLTYA